MITLEVTEAASGEQHVVWVPKETVHLDRENYMLSFTVYVGDTRDGDHLYIPYVLSHDRSNSHKELIHGAISAGTIANSTRAGYNKGASDPHAMRRGPNAMRASAFRGARGGFAYGLLFAALGEIRRHILTAMSQPHYYVSSHGPDLKGPIRIRADALV